MPRLSNSKKEKIQEQILFFLFSSFPKQVYTSKIAQEVARDEEFVKALLIELEVKGLVVRVTKNSKGVNYSKRLRWRLSNKAYEVYKSKQ